MSVKSALDAVMQMAVSTLSASAFTTVCPAGAVSFVLEGTPSPYAEILVREAPSDLETFSALMFRVEQRVRISSSYPGSFRSTSSSMPA